MSDGDADLARMIIKLRGLRGAEERVAQRAGPRVLEWVKAQAAAGLSPKGTPWKPTLKGEQPKLGRKITLRMIKNTIVLVLGGKSFLHHTGRARGKITRRVLPGQGAVPDAVRQILQEEARAEFKRTLRGR